MAVNGRSKGKRGELELAAFLREHGFEARRGRQFSGSQDSPDVLGLPGFHIECKRQEKVTIDAWMAQAEADAGLSTPVVVHRRNGRQWMVTLKLDAFLKIIQQERRHEQPSDPIRTRTAAASAKHRASA